MHQLIPISILLLVVSGRSSSADVLQNPDFESSPTGIGIPPPDTSPSEFVLLNQTTYVLPGWTFQGTVFYVNAGKTVSLLRNTSRAVQLGPDAKINQTFNAKSAFANASTYFLTITVTYAAAGGGGNCSGYATTVVSAPDSRTEIHRRDGYEGKPWQTSGAYLGSWEDGDAVNLVIESMSSDAELNSLCWPIVDSVLLKSVHDSTSNDGNLLQNDGFELGPDFLPNSTEGILLDRADSPLQSPLLHWSILGTIRYIDSDHFSVPAGKAAIEFVAGNSSGIQTATTLTRGSNYILNFTLGDAKDSCIGNLSVRAQAGSVLHNYSVYSSGEGSKQNFSMTFKAGSGTTPISFTSLATAQTKDGIFCGPVIDDIGLAKSSIGVRVALNWSFIVFSAIFATTALY